jgi:hypothetical protein
LPSVGELGAKGTVFDSGCDIMSSSFFRTGSPVGVEEEKDLRANWFLGYLQCFSSGESSADVGTALRGRILSGTTCCGVLVNASQFQSLNQTRL